MSASRRSLTPEEIDAAIAGERAAVEAFTAAYLPRVFGLCLRLCRERELAEEATQEAFVRALRALPRLRERERLTSWMLTIAANTTRELGRKRQRSGSLEWEPEAIEAEVDDRLVVRQKALDLALAGLEQDERELFLLHTVEGVKLRELAEEHQVSVPAMKSRVHRIRSKVRVLALEHLEAAVGVVS
ncbi:MAG: RNA polymerase sigma factor [Planctomycetota bacterium]